MIELSLGSFDCAQDGRKEARIFGLIKSAGEVERNMAEHAEGVLLK